MAAHGTEAMCVSMGEVARVNSVKYHVVERRQANHRKSWQCVSLHLARQEGSHKHQIGKMNFIKVREGKRESM